MVIERTDKMVEMVKKDLAPPPEKKPRKKRRDAGKPRVKERTIEDIKAEILDLVNETVSLTIAKAKVRWE